LPISRLILLGTWLICLLQMIYFYPKLPELVPSHFNGQGIATSFAPRNVLVGIYLGATLLVFLMFLGLGRSLTRGNTRGLNLPNKEYWLAPERRGETLATLAERMHWFGAATLGLFFDLFRQIFKVCLGEGRTLDHPKWSVGVYVAVSVVWVIALTLRFRRPSS